MQWSEMVQNSYQLQKWLKNYSKIEFFQNFQMTQKMFLDIVGVITTSKISILKTFQGGGAPGVHPIFGLIANENWMK